MYGFDGTPDDLNKERNAKVLLKGVWKAIGDIGFRVLQEVGLSKDKDDPEEAVTLVTTHLNISKEATAVIKQMFIEGRKEGLKPRQLSLKAAAICSQYALKFVQAVGGGKHLSDVELLLFSRGGDGTLTIQFADMHKLHDPRPYEYGDMPEDLKDKIMADDEIDGGVIVKGRIDRPGKDVIENLLENWLDENTGDTGGKKN